jgi:hypothetical protein
MSLLYDYFTFGAYHSSRPDGIKAARVIGNFFHRDILYDGRIGEFLSEFYFTIWTSGVFHLIISYTPFHYTTKSVLYITQENIKKISITLDIIEIRFYNFNKEAHGR